MLADVIMAIEKLEPQVKDIRKQIFNDILPIAHLGKQRHKKGSWLCICMRCGVEFITHGRDIRSGHVKSCPKCAYERMYEKKQRKFIGYKFGYDCEVIEQNKRKLVIRCGCGDIFNTNVDRINAKFRPVKDCEKCRRKRQSNTMKKCIINKVFGYARIIQRLEKEEHGGYFVLCQCDCGALFKARYNNLVGGSVKSCGCLGQNVPSGKNHYNYNLNITDEERDEDRITIEYKDMVKLTYKRDCYKCQICESNKNLNCHHLNSWNSFPQERYLSSNCITLCEYHHRLFHKIYGYGFNTKEQFQNFQQDVQCVTY